MLTALDEEPGLSNAELARRALVTPQTMNQVLRELEQRQWVIRHPHPGHGRILQAGLTTDGRSTLRACHRAAGAVEERMLAGLTPAQRQQLSAALNRRALAIEVRTRCRVVRWRLLRRESCDASRADQTLERTM